MTRAALQVLATVRCESGPAPTGDALMTKKTPNPVDKRVGSRVRMRWMMFRREARVVEGVRPIRARRVRY